MQSETRYKTGVKKAMWFNVGKRESYYGKMGCGSLVDGEIFRAQAIEIAGKIKNK